MQGRQCHLHVWAHDRVYPKGYPEMLEQQQGQLVSGLQHMYRRLIKTQAWTGPKLDEVNGAPLTHNIGGTGLTQVQAR
ncbi:hypothetical protein D0864_05546 [Hortaea werneckii]|uniref:Uncharacterized protein n=1 Tax=Hortaea werneckii TaxID=91943 RepID=A0A3M7FZR5_HORWE|nr:hypothetical protein D0864_05546 [Hortaea werneckii]